MLECFISEDWAARGLGCDKMSLYLDAWLRYLMSKYRDVGQLVVGVLGHGGFGCRSTEVSGYWMSAYWDAKILDVGVLKRRAAILNVEVHVYRNVKQTDGRSSLHAGALDVRALECWSFGCQSTGISAHWMSEYVEALDVSVLEWNVGPLNIGVREHRSSGYDNTEMPAHRMDVRVLGCFSSGCQSTGMWAH